MFEFFWVRAASVWVAALYIAMGVLLFAFPAASSTFFVWALAGGAAAYGVSHLVRYLQERKAAGKGNPGDLFLTVLPAAFSAFALVWPQTILAMLPLVLGSLLLVDGVGKLPLAITGSRDIMENHHMFMHPAHVTIRVLEPIETEGLTKEEIRALPQRTAEAIARHLPSHSGNR